MFHPLLRDLYTPFYLLHYPCIYSGYFIPEHQRQRLLLWGSELIQHDTLLCLLYSHHFITSGLQGFYSFGGGSIILPVNGFSGSQGGFLNIAMWGYRGIST